MSSADGEAGSVDVAYCVPGGQVFQSVYVQVHGYIALLICLLGSAANSVNIAVLSRKEMASSTNSILTGLAVADLLVMLDYIPFALHLYTSIGSSYNRNSYGWAVFIYFHSIFSQTFHTISIWLTITLAVWRFIAIKFPQKNRTLCNKRNTNVAIGLAYAVCPILCLPIYFAMHIQEVSRHSGRNETFNDTETVNRSTSKAPAYALMMTENQDLLTAIFWIYSVFIKLIPCVVLSILSVLLIMKMKSSDRRRQKLLKKSAISTSEGEKARLNDDSGGGGGGKRGGGGGRTDRTTRMLVALLGLFLATELPQALFGLLTAIAPHLFQICYYAFGEVMDLMALVGSAINFVLYCSMSRQFRCTFTRLARKVLPFPTADGEQRVPLKA